MLSTLDPNDAGGGLVEAGEYLDQSGLASTIIA
jgi:hypothetical protein